MGDTSYTVILNNGTALVIPADRVLVTDKTRLTFYRDNAVVGKVKGDAYLAFYRN